MDAQTYLEAYEQSARAVADLAAGRSAQEWAAPTDCPGWSVADQVAHVAALEHQFAGDPLPPALPEYGPHVLNAYGEHMERGVVAYRRADPDQASQELHAVLDRRFAALRDAPIDLAAETPGVLGQPVPWARFLPVRCFDVWAHEQDIRLALGRDVRFDGTSGRVALDSALAPLPMLVAKAAEVAAGTSVGFDVTGSPSAAVTVVVDAAGRGRAEPGLQPGTVACVRTDAATLTRLICGRTDLTAAAVTVDGDQELGRRVLASLTITP